MWESSPEEYLEEYLEDDQIKILHDWTDKTGDRWLVYIEPSITSDEVWVTSSYIDWQEGWYWDAEKGMLYVEKGICLIDEGAEQFLDVVTDIQEVK